MSKDADKTDEVFDASVPIEEPSSDRESESQVDDEFWDAVIQVEFTDTIYLPNRYTVDSDLHELEVLAYAYENNDKFARASMSDDDALRVWGWIVKKRTGRYPNSLDFVDKKAKRLRRWDLGPAANTLDFRVTPKQPRQAKPSSTQSSNFAPPDEDSLAASKQQLEEAAEHIQAAAQIIGEAAAEGIKEVADQVQQATQEIGKTVQIIAGIAEKDLRKWLKSSKKKKKKN